MIIISTLEYNPKIDYLVCKNLAKGLEKDYDEERIRDVYFEKIKAKSRFERMMINLKAIFKSINIIDDPNLLVKKIYNAIIEQKVNFNFYTTDFTYKNIKKIIEDLKDKGFTHNMIFAYFQVNLFVSLTLKYNLPIVPYHVVCSKIFYDLLNNNGENIFDKDIKLLIMRTLKLNHKHDINYNNDVISIVKSFKDLFLENKSIFRVGIYGSFSIGEANEYSDLDMLVVINDLIDRQDVCNYSYNFWSSRLDIPLDIKVVRIDELDDLNMHGLKRTLKYI